MAFIRSIDKIANKWGTVTPTRVGEYQDGIANPRRDWAKATTAAKDAYEAGVREAIAKDRFSRGVSKAGTRAWAAGAAEFGPSRWPEGVAKRQDKYRAGFAPYRDAIERTSLPPRYNRRDPRNLARVKAVVDALSKAKEGQLGRA